MLNFLAFGFQKPAPQLAVGSEARNDAVELVALGVS